MTPVLAVGTVVFAALRAWTVAAIPGVTTLIAAHGLWRERRLRIEHERAARNRA
jgi:hypothetical protein